MGSGPRFDVVPNEGFGLGLHFARFPFALTIYLDIFFWSVSIGLGKSYDE